MIVVAKNLSVLQLFIGRMPKMCAIYGHRNVLALLLKAAARKVLNGDWNPDRCDAGAVLSQ